jgi:hypothetical protein
MLPVARNDDPWSRFDQGSRRFLLFLKVRLQLFSIQMLPPLNAQKTQHSK